MAGLSGRQSSSAPFGIETWTGRLQRWRPPLPVPPESPLHLLLLELRRWSGGIPPARLRSSRSRPLCNAFDEKENRVRASTHQCRERPLLITPNFYK